MMVAHSNAPWTPLFARFFRDRGDDLVLVSFSPNPLDGVDGIHVECVGLEVFNKFKDKHLYFTRAPRVHRVVERFQPEVAFAPYLTSNGLSAALAYRGPIVVSAVGSDVMLHTEWTGLKRRLREMVVRYVCRRAAVVNTVSAALDEELIRLGVPASKLFRLPFGVNTQRFCAAEDMPRPAAARFICTRRHEALYEVGTVIDALAILRATGRDFHCTLTGEGSLWEDHQQRARSAGLEDHVTFTGHLPYADLPELLRGADVYISASRRDGTSVSLLEAMAAGLLPVVSRIPANTPWVEHGRTGLLFDVGNAEQLAQALATAMDDAQLRDRAFRENRPRVEREADMHHNMERLAAVLERLAATGTTT